METVKILQQINSFWPGKYSNDEKKGITESMIIRIDNLGNYYPETPLERGQL